MQGYSLSCSTPLTPTAPALFLPLLSKIITIMTFFIISKFTQDFVKSCLGYRDLHISRQG